MAVRFHTLSIIDTDALICHACDKGYVALLQVTGSTGLIGQGMTITLVLGCLLLLRMRNHGRSSDLCLQHVGHTDPPPK